MTHGVVRFFTHLSDNISARALRVPSIDVSPLAVILSVDKSTSAKKVNAAMSKSLDDFDGVLTINSAPLASYDFQGAEASSVLDTTQT